MAFAITHRLSSGSGTDATTYTTASVSVTAGDLLVIAYTNAVGTGPAPVVSAITGTLGSTLTCTSQSTVLSNSTQVSRTTIFTAPISSTTSGTFIFAHGGATQSSGQWTFCTITGADNTTPVLDEQSLAYAGATTTMTLSPAPGSTSMVFAAGNTNSATALTAGGTGYTFIGNGTAQTSPSVIHGCEYDLTSPSAVVGFTHTGTLNRGICAIEIAPASTSAFSGTCALSGSGTVSGTGVRSYPVSTLTDTFASLAAEWVPWDAETTVSSGRLRLNPVVGAVNLTGISRSDRWQFRGSRVWSETVDIGNQSLSTWEAWPLRVIANNDADHVSFMVKSGVLYAVIGGLGGVATTTYNVINHRYVQLREASGTVYWETSSDASSWTTLHSIATSALPALLNPDITTVGFTAGYNATETVQTEMLIDNINLTGSIGYTGTVGLSGSGTLTNAGSPKPWDGIVLIGSGTLTGSGTPGLSFSGSVALSGAGTFRGNQTLITLLDFESTTEGANLSAATLPTGWTYNETGSGFASTTVAAAAKNGTRGNHLTTTASTGTSYVKWDPAGNANVATRRVISFYFRANTAFSGSTEFASLKTVSGGSNCRFAFYPGTQLQFSLLGNTQVYITPKATVGVWYRIEMMCEGNQVELRAYNPDGSLFGSTTTGPNNQNTAVAWVGIVATSGSANANVDIDNVRYANDWLDSIPPELPLSGAGTLSLAGKPGVSGDTPLGGSGTLSLAGIAKPTGAITPNGAGTLSLTGIATPAQTLPLAGSGTLAFTGAKPAVSGSTTLSGVGLLNLSAGTNYSGFINPSGSGTLSLTGKVGLVGTTAYSGTGALSLVGVPKAVVTLALSGAGTLSGVGTPKLIVVRTLAGDGTLGGTGIKIGGGSDFIGALVLAGAGTANYAGKPAAKGALVLAGSGSLLLVALRKGTLDLTGSGVLSLTGMDLNLLRDVRIQVSAAYGYDLDVSGPEGAALLTHALRGYLLNVDGPVARAVVVGSAVGHRLRVEAFDEDPA